MFRVALAATVALSGIALSTAPASAEELSIPGSTTADPRSTAALEIGVPDGVRPTAVTGRLRLDDDLDGSVALVVNGRLAQRLPARAQSRVDVPVTRADVVDGRIQVQVRVDARDDAGETCAAVQDVRATLDDVQLQFDGQESAPASVADFFPTYAAGVDVVVPDDADDAELQAGLAAVAALSRRYPADTLVRLSTAEDAATTPAPGQRVVRIDGTSGAVRTAIDAAAAVPTLSLTGGADELTDAARALGSEALSLADAAETEGLAAGAPADTDGRASSLSIADLGLERAVLSGYGRVEQYIGIRQDDFGGPVGSLDLHLEGTHTAVPDNAQAQLDVYVNDRLIDSTLLGEDPAYTADLTVPAADLRGDNGLVLVLSSVPPADWCTATDRQLPLEFHLDTDASRVTDTGDAVRAPGFSAFPQVLGGRLPVAIADGIDGADRVAAAVDAGYLVSSLQRQSGRDLDVTLVEPGDLLDGSASGLVVGAGEDESNAVGSRLRFSEMRLLDYAEATFQVGTANPFAALTAVHEGGRDLLLLGSWAPGDERSADLERDAAIAAAADGWGSLSGDLLIAASEGEPFTIDSNAVVPQDDVVDEQRTYAWWFFGGLALLALLVVLRWALGRRRQQRISKLVDAQQAVDGAAAGGPDSGVGQH